MKFKHLFLTVSVMALFSSCSNEELVSETTSHGDAIAFSVTTSNATRAADYWCNSNLPKFFEVSATYKKDASSTAETYFDGDVYKAESGKYINADGISRFWPALSADTPLNVWAYKVKADAKNASEDVLGSAFATFAFNNGAPTITYDMTDKKAAADQHDLLYAYTQVTDKPGYGKTAPINFRHALSQIVFYAKCENTKIHVEIEEISIVNAAYKGVFTLPTANNVTNVNYKEHSQETIGTINGGLGTWALDYNNSNEYYGYTASCKNGENLKVVGSTWTNLTDNKNEGTSENGTHSEYTQSLLVLPQNNAGTEDAKRKAYVPYTVSGDTKTYHKLADVGGECIAIKCKIQNIAGLTYDANKDVYLWGSASAPEYLVVPVDFAWEQGKKYIYKINFSKTGHGGFDPNEGEEVLVPIQLSVTVDDFAKVTEIEKDI